MADDVVGDDVDGDDDFEVEVEGMPPQPARMAATKIIKQIRTKILQLWDKGRVRAADAGSMRRRTDLRSELF